MSDFFNPLLPSSASILDPMGYTLTSYLASPIGALPRPTSNTAFARDAIGTVADRYADRFEAMFGNATEGLQEPTTSLDDEAGDPETWFADTAANDPDAPEEPDEQLLARLSAGGDDEMDDLLTSLVSTGASATQTATPAPDLFPNATRPPPQPGMVPFVRIFHISGVPLETRVGGGGPFTVSLIGTTLKVVLQAQYKPGYLPPAYQSTITIGSHRIGVLFKTKTNEISISGMPQGSNGRYFADPVWHPIRQWANASGHLVGKLNEMDGGSKPAAVALKHYYSVWWHGRALLPNMGDLVQQGAGLHQSTFWAAVKRLGQALVFKGIYRSVQTEANTIYGVPSKLFLHASLTRGAQMTSGTAILAGFLITHHEITSHAGIAVIPNGKPGYAAHEFSLFIRKSLVTLGNVLNTSRYKGNYKRQIQQSVRRAAQYADLEHFFDGKNDPWNSASGGLFHHNHPRGRELQEARFPALPLSGRQPLTAQRSSQIGGAYAAVVALNVPNRANAIFVDLHERLGGAIARPSNLAQLDRDIRQAVNRSNELAEALINLLRIPDVIFREDGNVNANHINHVLDRPSLADPNVTIHTRLIHALREYIVDPINRTNRIRLDAVMLEWTRRVGGYRNATTIVNNARRIINTALIGADNVQPVLFPANPLDQAVDRAREAAIAAGAEFVPQSVFNKIAALVIIGSL